MYDVDVIKTVYDVNKANFLFFSNKILSHLDLHVSGYLNKS